MADWEIASEDPWEEEDQWEVAAESPWDVTSEEPAEEPRLGTAANPGQARPVDQPWYEEIPDAAQFGYQQFRKNQAQQMGQLFDQTPEDKMETSVRAYEYNRRVEAVAPDTEVMEGMQKLSESETWGEFFKNAAENPGAIGIVALQSLGRFAPALAAQAGIGAVGGPFTTSAMVGTTFSGSLGIEYGAVMDETVTEAGLDPDDPMSWYNAVQDRDLMARASERGFKRGIPIAAFDALTAGLAGKILAGAKPTAASIVPRSGAEMGMQAAGGGLGEASAQYVDKGKIESIGEIGLEAIAEMPSSIVETTVGYKAEKRAAAERERQKLIDDIMSANVRPLEENATAIDEALASAPPNQTQIDAQREQAEQMTADQEQQAADLEQPDEVLDPRGMPWRSPKNAELYAKNQGLDKQYTAVDTTGRGNWVLQRNDLVEQQQIEAEQPPTVMKQPAQVEQEKDAGMTSKQQETIQAFDEMTAKLAETQKTKDAFTATETHAENASNQFVGKKQPAQVETEREVDTTVPRETEDFKGRVFRTEDGVTWFEQSDGVITDQQDPAQSDMSYESFDQFATDWEGEGEFYLMGDELGQMRMQKKWDATLKSFEDFGKPGDDEKFQQALNKQMNQEKPDIKAVPELTPEEDAALTKQAETRMKQSQQATERTRKNLQPDENTDDLITYIRKLGGIDTDLESDVRGRLSQLNQNNKTVGLPGIEQKGGKGMSLDALGERLIEAGYLEPDPNIGNGVDKDKLIDLLFNAESGEPIYSMAAQDRINREQLEQQQEEEYEAWINQMADEEAAQIKAEIESLDIEQDNESRMRMAAAIDRAMDVDEAAVDEILERQISDDEVIEQLNALARGETDATAEAEPEAAVKSRSEEAPQPEEAERAEAEPFELTEEVSQEQQLKNLEVEKDRKRSPDKEVPEAQKADDLFATGGELAPDLFDQPVEEPVDKAPEPALELDESYAQDIPTIEQIDEETETQIFDADTPGYAHAAEDYVNELAIYTPAEEYTAAFKRQAEAGYVLGAQFAEAEGLPPGVNFPEHVQVAFETGMAEARMDPRISRSVQMTEVEKQLLINALDLAQPKIDIGAQPRGVSENLQAARQTDEKGYTDLANIELSAETETETMTQTADWWLNDIDNRINEVDKLRDCI